MLTNIVVRWRCLECSGGKDSISEGVRLDEDRAGTEAVCERKDDPKGRRGHGLNTGIWEALVASSLGVSLPPPQLTKTQDSL